jgi:AAA domain
VIQLLDASTRLAEPLCPKVLVVGPTAVGKTSLLKTLSSELLAATLLIDLEAGDLPIAHLPLSSIRLRTWVEARDVACILGGPDPAKAPGTPYSKDHHDKVVAVPAFADLQRYTIIFVDSYTELSRRCRVWAEQQPESFNSYGKRDTRGMYGLVGRELLAWTQQLQHARASTIILTAILEKAVDDYNAADWRVQLDGRRAGRELPAILDEIIVMHWVTFKDGRTRRAFVCQPSDSWPWGHLAKDRSGKLDSIEEPHLGKLLAKLAFRQPKEGA